MVPLRHYFWRLESAFIQPIEPNIVNRCGQSSAFVDRRSIGRSAPVRGHFSTATKLLRMVRIEDLFVRGFTTCLRLADGEILLRNGYHAAEGVLSTGLRCPCLRAPAAAFPHSAHSAPRGAAARRSSRTGVLWRSSQTRYTRPAKRYAPRGALRRRWSKRPTGCFIRCAEPGQRATLTPAGSGSPGTRRSMRRRRRCAVLLPRAVPKRWRSASPQAPGPLFPTRNPGSTG